MRDINFMYFTPSFISFYALMIYKSALSHPVEIFFCITGWAATHHVLCISEILLLGLDSFPATK